MKHLLYLIILIPCLFDILINEKFTLQGKLDGYETGTYIYLEIGELGILDSAIVENGTFIFQKRLEKSPVQAILRKKDMSQYKLIWLENKEMTINGLASNFRDAKVEGSETEYISQEFITLLEKVEDPDTISELEAAFMEKYSASIFSSFYLSLAATSYGKERTQRLFDLLTKENQDSEFGRQVQQFLALSKDLNIGDHYVDFVMSDEEGNPVSLSDLKGKVVLLEFWATWCAPCLEENPNLKRTYKKHKPKGFEILAVSLDTKGDVWRKVIKSDQLEWIHVSELSGSNNTASHIYNVSAIPDNFLINQNGIIVGRNLRGEELDKMLQMIFESL